MVKRAEYPPPPSNPQGKIMSLLYAETDEDVERLRAMEDEGIIRPSASFADLRADAARAKREQGARNAGRA